MRGEALSQLSDVRVIRIQSGRGVNGDLTITPTVHACPPFLSRAYISICSRTANIQDQSAYSRNHTVHICSVDLSKGSFSRELKISCTSKSHHVRAYADAVQHWHGTNFRCLCILWRKPIAHKQDDGQVFPRNECRSATSASLKSTDANRASALPKLRSGDVETFPSVSLPQMKRGHPI